MNSNHDTLSSKDATKIGELLGKSLLAKDSTLKLNLIRKAKGISIAAQAYDVTAILRDIELTFQADAIISKA